MTVHFIGAGPGAADVISVRGLALSRACPGVLYAGSLVPPGIVAEAGAETEEGAHVIDTAPMTLDEIGGFLGVTRERVRQLRNRALEKLRDSCGEILSEFSTN